MSLKKRGPLAHRSVNGGRKEGCAGFTLIELMVSIAILGTLVGIGIPAYINYVDKARNAKAIGDVSALQKEIKLYEAINEKLPDNLNQIGLGAMLDPWGNPYVYLKLGDPKTLGQARKDRFLVPLNTDFDLYSMGEDGKSFPPLTAAPSFDDILRANNGRFIGLASRF
jgi:general secretion pathway protein G